MALTRRKVDENLLDPFAGVQFEDREDGLLVRRDAIRIGDGKYDPGRLEVVSLVTVNGTGSWRLQRPWAWPLSRKRRRRSLPRCWRCPCQCQSAPRCEAGWGGRAHRPPPSGFPSRRLRCHSSGARYAGCPRQGSNRARHFQFGSAHCLTGSASQAPPGNDCGWHFGSMPLSAVVTRAAIIGYDCAAVRTDSFEVSDPWSSRPCQRFSQ